MTTDTTELEPAAAPEPFTDHDNTCACGKLELPADALWVCLCHGDGLRHARTACLDLGDLP